MATQTRISEDTHVTRLRLAAQTGLSHRELLEKAVRTYERELFLNRVKAGFAALKENEDAAKEYSAEVAALDGALNDGLSES